MSDQSNNDDESKVAGSIDEPRGLPRQIEQTALSKHLQRVRAVRRGKPNDGD